MVMSEDVLSLELSAICHIRYIQGCSEKRDRNWNNAKLLQKTTRCCYAKAI